MNFTDLKNDLKDVAPYLAAALSATGPAGMVAGGILQAVVGQSSPDAIHAELMGNPQALERVRLAEINSHEAITQALIQNATAQAATNTATASHPWLIGWRSIVGYDCALALTWQWLLLPVTVFFLGLAHISIQTPAFDNADLLKILGALLGLASWHGLETWQAKP